MSNIIRYFVSNKKKLRYENFETTQRKQNNT